MEFTQLDKVGHTGQLVQFGIKFVCRYFQHRSEFPAELLDLLDSLFQSGFIAGHAAFVHYMILPRRL